MVLSDEELKDHCPYGICDGSQWEDGDMCECHPDFEREDETEDALG